MESTMFGLVIATIGDLSTIYDLLSMNGEMNECFESVEQTESSERNRWKDWLSIKHEIAKQVVNSQF
jgi:hypothetical protein